jgi:hypothetical protein
MVLPTSHWFTPAAAGSPNSNLNHAPAGGQELPAVVTAQWECFAAPAAPKREPIRQKAATHRSLAEAIAKVTSRPNPQGNAKTRI